MEPQSLSIWQLLVNHENPRFEPVKNQTEAIDLMLQGRGGNEVLRLAVDIAHSSVNPTRSLMVIRVGEKYLVLDGNRRITALKLLHRPGLTKILRFREKFAELKRDMGTKIPDHVNCVVFPDKEGAYRWIKLEHTGKNDGVGTVGWDSIQKQRFRALFIGEKPSRPVQLFDYADAHTINREKVDASTLKRLLATKMIRELIGVSFPDGFLLSAGSESQLLNNVRKVFAAMSHSDFKVGDVYTVAKAKAWIEGILGITHEAEEKSKNGATQKTETKGGSKTKTKTKAGPLAGDWIMPALHKAYSLDNRVKDMLGELKSGLKPATKPNVCATSLRVLLELAVYVFLWDEGEIKKLIVQAKSEHDAKNKKRAHKQAWEKLWTPSFKEMLDHLSSDESLIPNPSARTALSIFISKKTSEPFLAELNQFMHNPDYHPTHQMVTDIWNSLGKLVFKAILEAQDEDTN